MSSCERCGSTRVSWFTPTSFGRQAGIFLCLECSKVNVRLPGRRPRREPGAVRGSDEAIANRR